MASTPNIDLAEELLKLIPKLGRTMSHYIQKEGETELTMMQMGVLFHLQNCPMTASDLAKKRQVSLQSASVLVQGLVEKGWVTREPNPADRRQFLLQLTPAGVDLSHQSKQKMVAFLAELLSQLTAEELTAGQQFLPALHRTLLDPSENQTEESH